MSHEVINDETRQRQIFDTMRQKLESAKLHKEAIETRDLMSRSSNEIVAIAHRSGEQGTLY